MNAAELSGQLLNSVRTREDTSPLLGQIRDLQAAQLTLDLDTQEARLVFWLNLYNAFFQIKVQEDPAVFSGKMKLFMGRHFIVAGWQMSLDEIEHDMLRKTVYKWSLGYIQKPFPSSFKRNLRVFNKDPRVHFAMNCGAKSCPPIRFYDRANIHEQLEIATRSFLSQEVRFDARTNTAHATSLFSWFRGDFGGTKGVKEFLFKYDLIPSVNINLKFTEYDWSKAFNNYV